jgi:hypothetical protein
LWRAVSRFCARIRGVGLVAESGEEEQEVRLCSKEAFDYNAGEDDQFAAAELIAGCFALLQTLLTVERLAVGGAGLVLAARGFSLDFSKGMFKFKVEPGYFIRVAVFGQVCDDSVSYLYGATQAFALDFS